MPVQTIPPSIDAVNLASTAASGSRNFEFPLYQTRKINSGFTWESVIIFIPVPNPIVRTQMEIWLIQKHQPIRNKRESPRTIPYDAPRPKHGWGWNKHELNAMHFLDMVEGIRPDLKKVCG